MLRALIAFSLWLATPCGCVSRAYAHDAQLIEARLGQGPHPPGDAPDVIVHIPSHYDARKPVDLVVFLHGFDGCTRALVAAAPVPCRDGEPPHRVWDLARLHEQAGTHTILIMPQLAYLARTAKGHRFLTEGAFDAMLHELFSGPLAQRLGSQGLAPVHSVTLIAHSAGYGATLAIVNDARRLTPVQHVVLLDALYAGWHDFAMWAKRQVGNRLVSLYTAQPKTQAGNRLLVAELAGLSVLANVKGDVEKALRASPRVVARVATAHGDLPRAHLVEVLRGLPLGRRDP